MLQVPGNLYSTRYSICEVQRFPQSTTRMHMYTHVHTHTHTHTHTHSLLGILSSTPTSTDAAYTLGLVYQDLKVPHEAKEMFLKTLQLDPKHKQAKAQLASLQN